MKYARTLTYCIYLIVLVILSGCANTNHVHNVNDPLERYNRAMFNFNDAVDHAVLQPAARAYQFVLPQFIQTGIGHFFGNIDDLRSALNQILQARIEAGVTSLMRVAINTVFGLGGLLDIST